MELSNNVEQLEDRIRVMELDSQRLLETAEAVAEEKCENFIVGVIFYADSAAPSAAVTVRVGGIVSN